MGIQMRERRSLPRRVIVTAAWPVMVMLTMLRAAAAKFDLRDPDASRPAGPERRSTQRGLGWWTTISDHRTLRRRDIGGSETARSAATTTVIGPDEPAAPPAEPSDAKD